MAFANPILTLAAEGEGAGGSSGFDAAIFGG